MRLVNKFLLGCILFLSVQSSFAQLSINGEIRTKTMLLDGYKQLFTKSQHAYGITVQRSRLSFDYQKENMSFGLSVQDIRNWGQDAITANNTNLGIFEAWAKYNFTKEFAIKIGRQQIKYDDERLITASNWTDQGVVHDILVLQYDNKEIATKTDVGLAMNNNTGLLNYLTDYTVKNYKYLAYVWISKSLLENKLSLSLMSIMDVNQKTASPDNLYSRYTIGPNISFKNDKFKFNTAFYYQGGNLVDGRTIYANFFSAKLGYKIISPLEFTIGVDHYSGTDYKDTTLAKTKSTTFDKLYGSTHHFLGYMDYFTGTGSDITKGAGINDLFLRTSYDVSEKHNIELSYHWFYLDKSYIPVLHKASYSIHTFLGSELDFLYTFKHSKTVNLSVGYNVMFQGESLEYLHGIAKGESKFAQFAYLMLTFKPNFFTSKD
ncbi:MAG: alginate export family protein [Bacteroidetes bacterium]|nr:alginate export family protein [Bacteroidota bacterium]